MQYDDRTAIIVTDVQNDFADPRGRLYVDGGEKIVDAINRQIERARRAGALVAYTQDWHPPQTPHFQKDGGVWPVHCVRDTWGAEFHPRLHVRGEVVRKGSGGEDGYSGFSVRDPLSAATQATELEGLLRDRDIERVAIVGIATDYCVKETALDALRLGFDTTLLADLVRAVDLQPGDGERALQEIAAQGGRLEAAG
jgi:nicotinamidase/pyrazinamidase